MNRILEKRTKETSRKDDNKESIIGRINNFNNLSNDIRDHFKNQSHVHYLTVDVSKSTPDEIVNNLLEQIKKLEKKQRDNNNQSKQQHQNEIGFLQKITGTKRAEILQFALELTQGPWDDKAKYPATEPVPLDQENFHIISGNLSNYRIVRKLDGERKVAVVQDGSLYFLSRSFMVEKDLSLTIPSDWNDSVFDGELATLFDTKQTCFFVFDCMVARGEKLNRKNLDSRLHFVEHFCEKINSIPGDDNQNLGKLFIQPQMYYSTRYTEIMLKLKTKTVPVANRNLPLPVPFNATFQVAADGLIFIPNRFYRFGSAREVLKWKYPELMTLDFSIFRKTDEENNEYLELNSYKHKTSKFIPYGKLFPIPQVLKRAPDGTIVECLKKSDGTWEFQRIRSDRAYPNADWVVKSALRIELVTEQELIKLCSKDQSNWRNSNSGRGGGGNRGKGNYSNRGRDKRDKDTNSRGSNPSAKRAKR